MAESQKIVGTDAITGLIAAILALANALDKKGALSFEEYRDALLSMSDRIANCLLFLRSFDKGEHVDRFQLNP